MADVTIKTKSSGRGRTVKNWRPFWYPVIQGEENDCRYCGHSMRDHGGQRLSFTPKGKINRVTHGTAITYCHRCAKEKQTHQVICYKAPGIEGEIT